METSGPGAERAATPMIRVMRTPRRSSHHFGVGLVTTTMT